MTNARIRTLPKPRILLVTLEFRRWPNASHYPYPLNFGIEEGFQALGIDFTTLPAPCVHEIEERSPLSWLHHGRELCRGKVFDQVWLEIVHSSLSEDVLFWLAEISPVRVGFIPESMEIAPGELVNNSPGTLRRVANLQRNLQYVTHVVACDEADVERFNAQGRTPAFWWAGGFIPERFIERDPPAPQFNSAAFYGTPYGERRQWLEHPQLSGLIVQPAKSIEAESDCPARFDTASLQSEQHLAVAPPVSADRLQEYLRTLRATRSEGFGLWLASLRQGCAVINLPQFGKAYASRVVEGMAAGRPVISWELPDRPRSRNLFVAGEEILLYRKNAPEQLVEHIRHVQLDPEFGRRIASNARHKLLEEHTTEVFVQRLTRWLAEGEQNGCAMQPATALIMPEDPRLQSASGSAITPPINGSVHIVPPGADIFSVLVRKGDLVFDVGANTGAKTRHFLELGCRVVCFEPQPSCAEKLRAQFAGNDRVAVVQKGVADKSGRLRMAICPEAPTISTFSQEWQQGRFANYQWSQHCDVEMTTLDEAIKEFGIPKFVKIDVEGFEYEVLSGLDQKVPFVSFEFTHEFRARAYQCIRHLQSLGFTQFNFAEAENAFFTLTHWVGGGELSGKIEKAAAHRLDFWGDVYAASAVVQPNQTNQIVPADPLSAENGTGEPDADKARVTALPASEISAEGTDSAEASARLTLAKDPNNLEALRTLALVCAQTERYAEGGSAAFRCVEQVRTDVQALELLATCLLESQQFEGARSALLLLLEAQPDHLIAKKLLSTLPPEENGAASGSPSAGQAGARTTPACVSRASAPAKPLLPSGGEAGPVLEAAGLWSPGQPLRLHLGCGEQHFQGYINIDYPTDRHNVMRVRADAFGDISRLVFAPGTVDEIRLHHVFEHFNRVTALSLLIRWHGWLKRGGILHLETPDMEGSAKMLASDSSFRFKMAAVRHLAGDQAAPWAYHVDHWFPERFEHTLRKLGFDSIHIQTSAWPRPPYLANVEAIAVKDQPLSDEQLLEAADTLLWESTVAEEERPTFEVWQKQLRALLAGGAAEAPSNTAPPNLPATSDVVSALSHNASRLTVQEIHDFNQRSRDQWVERKAATVRAGSRVLDIGAGTCPYRRLFAHCEYKTHDFKEYDGIKLGNTRDYGHIDYESDVTHLPVPDHSFDVILCTEVLEHVPEPIEAIREMARILKPGGRLLLTAPLGSGLHQLPYHFYGGYTPEWYRYVAKKFDLEVSEISPNGGFFKLLAQECARVAWTLPQHQQFHGSNTKLIQQLFGDWLPRYLFGLEDRCFIDQFTVGYHVEAVIKNRSQDANDSHHHNHASEVSPPVLDGLPAPEAGRPAGVFAANPVESSTRDRHPVGQQVVVKLQGGLGNQMFQYAMGRSLASSKRIPLKLDAHTGFLHDPYQRTYALGAFSLTASFATPEEIQQLFQRDAQDQEAYPAKPANRRHIIRETRAMEFHYEAQLIEAPDEVYLEGYWQHERYFRDMADVLRHEFRLRAPSEGLNRDLADRIATTPGSVAVHFRRRYGISADGQTCIPGAFQWHGTCPLEYYRAALTWLRQQVGPLHLFIFSDDPDWTVTNGQFDDPFTQVRHNDGQHAQEDLRLMSLCRHHVIANSTFSWWAAWLSEHPNKIVIAPQKWFNDPSMDARELIPAGWYQLEPSASDSRPVLVKAPSSPASAREFSEGIETVLLPKATDPNQKLNDPLLEKSNDTAAAALPETAGKRPTVSVVIPCFRQAQFLPEAVESVVRQTYADWELIIINDGSPDETSAVARSLMQQYAGLRLRFMVQTNGGLADARNTGIRASQGRYILPLDADDRLDPHYLERTVSLLESHPELAVAYTDLQCFGHSHEVISKGEFGRNLFKENQVPYCALFRRQAWEMVSGYRLNLTLGYEDWDFWIGLVEQGCQGRRIPESLFYYRVRPQSMVSQAWAHHQELVARIILNHPGVYDLELIRQAEQTLATSPLPAPRRQVPRVSVVIPCYRQAQFLPEAVRSVVEQTRKDWEAIIVNDGSPDETSPVAEALMRQFPDCILRLIEQPNEGLSSARNAGMRLAQGPYLCPLDADDKIQPTYLGKLLSVMENRRELGFVYPDIHHFGDFHNIFTLPEFNARTLVYHDNIVSGTAVYRKSMWDQVGGYDETMKEGYEDWNFWISCVERGWQGHHVPEPLFCYRKRSQSMLPESNRKRPRLIARIVLNHPRLYDEPTKTWARKILGEPESPQIAPARMPATANALPGAADADLQQSELPSKEGQSEKSPGSGRDRLRVTFLISNILGVTGGNQTLLRQANALIERGHEVTIVTYTPKPAWFPLKAGVIQVPPGEDMAGFVPSSDTVISTYFANTHELLQVSAPVKIYFAQGDQYVFEDEDLNQNADNEEARCMRALSKASYLRPEIRFVANSRNLAQAVEKKYGRRADAILPVCVDQTIFQRNPQRPTGPPWRILVVGPDLRGTAREPLLFKGLSDIREALELLAQRREDFEVVRMSSTPPELFRNFPCAFHIAPSDAEKTRLYGGAHILIYASHYDSCPRPPQEAMAAGVAVVCTSTSGAQEYCRDGENCLLIPVKSPEAIAIATERLITDCHLRERLVQGGLETARQYPQEREWNELEALLYRFRTETTAAPDTAMSTSAHEKPAHQSTVRSSPAPRRITIDLPAVAQLGRLKSSYNLLKAGKYREAWNAGLAALKTRPFHPEAYVMLGETAQAAGDLALARRCSERALQFAPHFPLAVQLAASLSSGGKGNRVKWPPLPENRGSRQGGQPAQGSNLTRLSVCLIVRNEESFIGQCLASVRNLASQIVVVDTGSSDRTVAIAKEHGAEVHAFAWNDNFSDARNVALARATGDWILMLDADEELPESAHDKLRAEMQDPSVLGYRLPIVNHGMEAEGIAYVPRLFRNAPGLFYVGRVHEQVFPSVVVRCGEWGLQTKLGTATILHYGYDAAVVRNRQKVNRNLNLLWQAVKELPDEPNLEMNLGLELVRSGKLDEGVKHYFVAFDLMSQQPQTQVVPELREALLTQLTTHLMRQKNHLEIVRVLGSSLAQPLGMTASLHYTLGFACFQLGRYADTAEQMRLCLAKRTEAVLSPIVKEIKTAAPRHVLAVCLANLKQNQAADTTFREAMQEDPRSRPVRYDYARFHFSQDRPVEALKLLHELIEEKPDEAAVWELGGQIALSKPEFLEFAGDWTGEAMKQFPDHPMIIAQRAEVLLLNQQTAESLPLWRQLPGPQSPRHIAAIVLCEIMGNSLNGVMNGTDETGVSQEFIHWYRRLVQAGAETLIRGLNQRLDQVRRVLPRAAQLLEGVAAAADKK